jgi:hypothetical protein
MPSTPRDFSLAVGDGARRMTYAELAVVRGISALSAERLVRRRWPRQTGNDGVVRVLVPLTEARKASGHRRVSSAGHQEVSAPKQVLAAGALSACSGTGKRRRPAGDSGGPRSSCHLTLTVGASVARIEAKRKGCPRLKYIRSPAGYAHWRWTKTRGQPPLLLRSRADK